MQSLRFCKHYSNPINGRPNKKFCSPNCRKRFSEGLQNSFESREKKKRNYILFDSAARLAKIYFAQSPFERLGLMQTYISMAREGNSKMREILSNSYLRSSQNDYGNPYKVSAGATLGAWPLHVNGTVGITGTPLLQMSYIIEQTNLMMES